MATGSLQDLQRFCRIPSQLYELVAAKFGGIASLEKKVGEYRVTPLSGLGFRGHGTPDQEVSVSLVLQTWGTIGVSSVGGGVCLVRGFPETAEALQYCSALALATVFSRAIWDGCGQPLKYSLSGTMRYPNPGGFELIGAGELFRVVGTLFAEAAMLHSRLPQVVELEPESIPAG